MSLYLPMTLSQNILTIGFCNLILHLNGMKQWKNLIIISFCFVPSFDILTIMIKFKMSQCFFILFRHFIPHHWSLRIVASFRIVTSFWIEACMKRQCVPHLLQLQHFCLPHHFVLLMSDNEMEMTKPHSHLPALSFAFTFKHQRSNIKLLIIASFHIVPSLHILTTMINFTMWHWG